MKQPGVLEKEEILKPTKYGNLFLKIVEDAQFTNIDKITSILAYFSATLYRDKQKLNERKTIELPNYAHNGRRINIRVEIIPAEGYGLPTISDLTMWIGFLQILYKNFFDGRRIHQPITFRHHELLDILRFKSKGDQVYEMVNNWLLRMQGTQIKLHGGFVENKKKEQIIGTSLFSDIKIFGNVDENGNEIKDNQVWLSEYMLQRLLEDPPLVVNFDSYSKIKNQTARLLMVYLQTWLYASSAQGYFQKDYSEFCALFGLTEYGTANEIRKQLKPAFNALSELDYVAAWAIKNLSNREGFKITIKPGVRYREDAVKISVLFKRNAREDLSFNFSPDTNSLPSLPCAGISAEQQPIYEKLLKIGIWESPAKKIIKRFSPDVLSRRIFWAQAILEEEKRTGKIIKADGAFLAGLINSDAFIPENFKTPEEVRAAEQKKREAELGDDRAIEEQTSLLKEFERFCFNEAKKNTRFTVSAFESSFREGKSSWNQVLEIVRKNLDSQVFEAWFKRLTFAGWDRANRAFYICTMSEVTRDWVTSYYADLLERAFAEQSELAGHEIKWLVTADSGAAEVLEERNDGENEVSGCRERESYERILIDDYLSRTGAISFDEFCSKRKTGRN